MAEPKLRVKCKCGAIHVIEWNEEEDRPQVRSDYGKVKEKEEPKEGKEGNEGKTQTGKQTGKTTGRIKAFITGDDSYLDLEEAK